MTIAEVIAGAIKTIEEVLRTMPDDFVGCYEEEEVCTVV